jgi:hypothetical protein
MSERCAIYFAPPPGSDLARFAAEWFARPDVREITASPRHYGFHATMKPPFRLAPGRDLEGLKGALAAFARTRAPVSVGRLKVASLSGFLALVPAARNAELADLAQACIEDFDVFRAPPSEAELAKRRTAGLTPRQEDLLQRWGYPYVAEEFRWHMTLTERLPDRERARLQEELERLAAPVLAEPLAVSSLSVFRQPDPATAFAEVARETLAGVP